MEGIWNLIRGHLPGGSVCMHLKKEDDFPNYVNVESIRQEVMTSVKGIPEDMHSGRRLEDRNTVTANGDVSTVLRLRGGKGGFGSMLRAIGAQIEKTTNREACRDLSGRRLRDINEEKRLKKWIAQKAEREREAIERKKKKLEQMCREPKHEFHDPKYDRQRSELAEKVSDAVDKGFQVAASSSSSSSSAAVKRKIEKQVDKGSKKQCLWLGVDEAELNDLSSDEDSSDEVKAVASIVSTEASKDESQESSSSDSHVCAGSVVESDLTTAVEVK